MSTKKTTTPKAKATTTKTKATTKAKAAVAAEITDEQIKALDDSLKGAAATALEIIERKKASTTRPEVVNAEVEEITSKRRLRRAEEQARIAAEDKELAAAQATKDKTKEEPVGMSLKEALAEEAALNAKEPKRAPKVAEPSDSATKAKKAPRLEGTVFEKHPVTQVIRWMGGADWSAEEAVAVLQGMGIACQVEQNPFVWMVKPRLRAACKAGETTFGPLPELTAKEIADLKARRKAVQPPPVDLKVLAASMEQTAKPKAPPKAAKAPTELAKLLQMPKAPKATTKKETKKNSA